MVVGKPPPFMTAGAARRAFLAFQLFFFLFRLYLDSARTWILTGLEHPHACLLHPRLGIFLGRKVD